MVWICNSAKLVTFRRQNNTELSFLRFHLRTKIIRVPLPVSYPCRSTDESSSGTLQVDRNPRYATLLLHPPDFSSRLGVTMEVCDYNKGHSSHIQTARSFLMNTEIMS